MTADPIALIEAGYRHATSESDWLAGVASASTTWSCGFGIAACAIDLAGETPRVAAFAAEGVRDEAFEADVRAVTSSLDMAVARRAFAPTEFVGNAAHRLRRIQAPALPSWALVAGDPQARAVAVFFPGERASFDPEARFPHKPGRLLGLAGAHLGAALRLRKLAAPLADNDTETEGVFDPAGKVLHAVGPARDRAARETLVEAVVRRERARGRLRRVAPDEAAEMWSVLVDGRWSIVDTVERDGKRLVLARKNPVTDGDVLTLTPEERDVVWLTSLGHSYKYIAYELGISAASVHRRLGRALRKLRLRTRADLLRTLGRSAS